MTEERTEEEYVNMPLKPEVKSALKVRAAENGRNVGREAAAIVRGEGGAK